MNKNVSTREIILLAILVALIAYYYGVQMPIQRQMETITAQQAEIESELDQKTSMLVAKTQMEKSIRQAMDEAGGNPQEMPAYDNSDAVMAELNGILASAQTYSINFTKQDAETSAHVIRRSVSLSYSTADYATALDMIKRLSQSPYENQISDLTITNGASRQNNETKPVANVSMVMTFYEYTTQAQTQTQTQAQTQ